MTGVGQPRTAARARAARLTGLTVCLLLGCSKSPEPGSRAPAAGKSAEAGASSESARAAAPVTASAPSPTPAADGDAAAPAKDAGLPDTGAPADAGAGLAGKVVLHAGDSMVGGDGGLTKALGAKFRAEGAKFVRDYEVSVSIGTFARTAKLKNLLVRHKPDIVILTLGANDVFIPFPQNFATHVEAIVKKIGDRECYWIGPPTWKPDSGIVAVIREHVAPCKFFDSSNLPLKRGGDHIHPTDKGGAEWAELFWSFYRGTGPAAPGLLDAGAPP